MGDVMHGLSDLAMWLFITVVTVAAMLLPLLRRLTRQREIRETIRALAESGQTIDPDMVERLLGRSGDKDVIGSSPSCLGRKLALPALIVMAIGIGLAMLGYFIGLENDGRPVYPLYGVGAMVFLIGLALGVYAVWLLKAFPREGAGPDR
jgi:hypothetical protein